MAVITMAEYLAKKQAKQEGGTFDAEVLESRQDMMEKLDDMGIEYPKNAKREYLEKLLKEGK